eukprot:scaffold1839_cov382-Prasinococcus_capsulatus_cf.AAC.25
MRTRCGSVRQRSIRWEPHELSSWVACDRCPYLSPVCADTALGSVVSGGGPELSDHGRLGGGPQALCGQRRALPGPAVALRVLMHSRGACHPVMVRNYVASLYDMRTG